MTEETSPGERPRMKDVPRNLEPYFVGLLLKGERWDDTAGAEAAELMPRHLAFLRAQVEAGRYVLAGPVMDEGAMVGLILLRADTLDDARALVNSDPGVQSGRMAVEVHPALFPTLKGLKVEF